MPVINFIWLFGQQNIDRHGRGQKNFSNNRNVLWKQIGFRRQHRKKTIVALLFRVFRDFFSRVPFRSYRTHGERGENPDPTLQQQQQDRVWLVCAEPSSDLRTFRGLIYRSRWRRSRIRSGLGVAAASYAPLHRALLCLYVCLYVCLLVYRAKSSIFQIFPSLNRVPNGHPRHIGFGAVFRFAALVSLTSLFKKKTWQKIYSILQGALGPNDEVYAGGQGEPQGTHTLLLARVWFDFLFFFLLRGLVSMYFTKHIQCAFPSAFARFSSRAKKISILTCTYKKLEKKRTTSLPSTHIIGPSIIWANNNMREQQRQKWNLNLEEAEPSWWNDLPISNEKTGSPAQNLPKQQNRG